MTRLLLLLALALVHVSAYAQPAPLSATSPDGTLTAMLTLDADGTPMLSVERFGRTLVEPSPLGFRLTDGTRLDTGLRLVGSETAERDTTWTTVWGERERVRDHHRQVRAAFQNADGIEQHVVLRVFDDGVGFRYEWPAQEGLGTFEIAEEVTQFRFAAPPTAWWIPAYDRERYEYLYTESPLVEADTVHTPLTLRTPDNVYMALHEAALVDFASMTLAVVDSSTVEADLVPWSTGVKVYAEAPHASPWRVLLVGDTPGDLAESDLVLNLNEPNRLEDVSWIEPQKYVGIWWEMHLGTKTWHSGENHGATTEHAKRYVDFAADHGFGGVLVEGWNLGWDDGWIGPEADFSFTEPYPDFDPEEVSRYARERGVRLIGHHETGGDVPNYEAQLDEAMAFYEDLGVRAVKTGYVNWAQGIPRTSGPGVAPGDTVYEWHHGQHMVDHYQRTVEEAAEHRVMVNIHEPIKDTGLRRTWPNLMTREGARGQEYNAAWGGGNGPDHVPTVLFTRMLSGPFDYTPGIVHLTDDGTEPENAVQSTLAQQLALYVVLYSPLQMAADLPWNYEEAPEALRFIETVPADWAETHVLDGAIGDYAIYARRARGSDEWFLGAITDDAGRRLEAPLSFLEAGRTYVAEIWRDGQDADWTTNPLAMEVEQVTVTASDTLPLRLAPGGGAAVYFRPVE